MLHLLTLLYCCDAQLSASLIPYLFLPIVYNYMHGLTSIFYMLQLNIYLYMYTGIL